MVRITSTNTAWRLGLLLATNALQCRGWLVAPLMNHRHSTSSSIMAASKQYLTSSVPETALYHATARAMSTMKPLSMSSTLDEEQEASSSSSSERMSRGRPPPVKPKGAFVLLEGMYLCMYR